MFAHEDVHHLLGSVAIEGEVLVSTYWQAAVPLLRRRRSMSVFGYLRTHVLTEEDLVWRRRRESRSMQPTGEKAESRGERVRGVEKREPGGEGGWGED